MGKDAYTVLKIDVGKLREITRSDLDFIVSFHPAITCISAVA